MNSATPSPERLQSLSRRSSLDRRWALGFGIFLFCYLVVAYLLVPQAWKLISKDHPSFDDNPRITHTADGHPGDAINVALTGSEKQLNGIMLAAKWYPANPLGLESDLKIGVDTVLKRSYDEAPVSKLFLFGRPEDLAFEQPVGDDPRHRHHVRFWRTKTTDQNRPVWVGSATYDERVGLSYTTGQITHHTAPDIDAERAHVFATLQQTGDLAVMYKIAGFHNQLEGRNGGGDRWYTDGALWVGVIKKSFKDTESTATD